MYISLSVIYIEAVRRLFSHMGFNKIVIKKTFWDYSSELYSRD